VGKLFLLALSGLSALAQPQPDPAAAEFSINDRWQYYVQRTYSWERLALLGADASFDHMFRQPWQWRRTSRGFLYRYGSGFGRRTVRNSIELGAGIVLREDTRFQPSGEQAIPKRLQFAATNALLARKAGGHRGFAYSRLAAAAGGFLVASTWHPWRRSPEHFAESIGYSYLGHLEESLFTEFSPDMIRIGKRVRLRILGK
jgi:hypothetical protein